MKTMIVLALVGMMAPALLAHYTDYPSDHRIYTFAFYTNNKPFEFISKSGDLMGFNVDIVRKVCEMAYKMCSIVVYNNASLCWNSKLMYGEGLSGRYWDVCVGYSQTKERMLAYGFLGAYTDESPAYVYAMENSRINSYDPGSHRSGFLRASRLSPGCIRRRLGTTVKDIMYYSNQRELIQALKSNQVDVIFISEERMAGSDANRYRKVSNRLRCAEKGYSLMMRKDTVPDFQWFDKIVREEILTSVWYKWICNVAKLAYGGDPICLQKKGAK